MTEASVAERMATDSSCTGLRARLAGALLVGVIAVPVISTIWLDSIQTNNLVGCLQFLFVLILLPEVMQEVRRWSQGRLFRIAAVVAVFCMVSWKFNQGPFMNIARFWLYLILILFFAAAIGWFRLIDHGLKLVFLAKAGTTFIAMLAMAIAIMTIGTGHELFVHPPIYRHLRHLNYDLIVVAALGFSSWLGATKKARYGYVAMFLALGYFSIWSGGRGEALALIVFFAALLGFGVTQWREKHFQVTLAALLLGGILVIGSGQTQFLSGQLGKL